MSKKIISINGNKKKFVPKAVYFKVINCPINKRHQINNKNKEISKTCENPIL